MQKNTLQRLDELIEESREIETQAQRLQAEGPLSPGSPYAVQHLQKRSKAWYANAFDLLPPDLRHLFEREWIGLEGDCGQQDFLAAPTPPGPDRRQAYDDARLQTIDPTKFRFTYLYERCFQQPLHRQRQVLMHAKHHPDIARNGRSLDAQGIIAGLNFGELHPQLVRAVETLFATGHYRDAILRSCIALADTVRQKSGSEIKDDTPLMRHVFSAKKPVLKVSNDEGEREGMLSLFAGVTMGLRNPRAHHLGDGEDLDPTEAFEWLVFISALMRVIDRAEPVVTASDAS
jgi:uncharacterized protein (TIGR02391 family)